MVLKMMFWEIPPADWLILQLPTAYRPLQLTQEKEQNIATKVGKRAVFDCVNVINFFRLRGKGQKALPPGEARDLGLHNMRLTRCLLRYEGLVDCNQNSFGK